MNFKKGDIVSKYDDKWTERRPPVDISYKLRNLWEDVMTPITGQTRNFDALTSDLSIAEQAKASMDDALNRVFGESSIEHSGIKVFIREHNTDSYSAYFSNGQRVFLNDGNTANASSQKELGRKLDAYFSTDWEEVAKDRQKTDSKPFDLAPAFTREQVEIRHNKGVTYTVSMEVPRGIKIKPEYFAGAAKIILNWRDAVQKTPDASSSLGNKFR